jgi:Spy/CpxP family protein refolding chaperone
MGFMTKWLLMIIVGASWTQSQSPYAGEEAREIKALSPEESHELAAGAGMGMARAAELNGFPGPRHVLELAEGLELTIDQRRAVSEVFDRMRARAMELGEAVIESERTLDAGFAGRTLDAEQLRRATQEVAALRGELRYVHLVAHLETTALLGPRQIEAYARLRGYGTGDHEGRQHH